MDVSRSLKSAASNDKPLRRLQLIRVAVGQVQRTTAHRHEREPEGRYLAGFDPDVVARPGKGRAGPAGPVPGMTRSGSSAAGTPKPAAARHRSAPCSTRAAPRASRCRCPGVAVAFEPAGLPRVAENPRASGPAGTARPGRALPGDAPPRRRGTVPGRRLVAAPVHPPCNLRAARVV